MEPNLKRAILIFGGAAVGFLVADVTSEKILPIPAPYTISLIAALVTSIVVAFVLDYFFG